MNSWKNLDFWMKASNFLFLEKSVGIQESAMNLLGSCRKTFAMQMQTRDMLFFL